MKKVNILAFIILFAGMAGCQQTNLELNNQSFLCTDGYGAPVIYKFDQTHVSYSDDNSATLNNKEPYSLSGKLLVIGEQKYNIIKGAGSGVESDIVWQQWLTDDTPPDGGSPSDLQCDPYSGNVEEFNKLLKEHRQDMESMM